MKQQYVKHIGAIGQASAAVFIFIHIVGALMSRWALFYHTTFAIGVGSAILLIWALFNGGHHA